MKHLTTLNLYGMAFTNYMNVPLWFGVFLNFNKLSMRTLIPTGPDNIPSTLRLNYKMLSNT